VQSAFTYCMLLCLIWVCMYVCVSVWVCVCVRAYMLIYIIVPPTSSCPVIPSHIQHSPYNTIPALSTGGIILLIVMWMYVHTLDWYHFVLINVYVCRSPRTVNFLLDFEVVVTIITLAGQLPYILLKVLYPARYDSCCSWAGCAIRALPLVHTQSIY
jgi:hypothetical protein